MNWSNETHRISRYRTFARLYDIQQFDLFVSLYDIDELMSLMPTNPTHEQKHTLNDLIGVTASSSYLDYEKSNNTFTLVRNWQEANCSRLRQRRRMR